MISELTGEGKNRADNTEHQNTYRAVKSHERDQQYQGCQEDVLFEQRKQKRGAWTDFVEVDVVEGVCRV
jgi:hypothetical protein